MINTAIEKLELLDLDKIRERYKDGVIFLLAFKVEEALQELKAIERVTVNEIKAHYKEWNNTLPGKLEWPKYLAKKIDERMFGIDRPV